MVKIMADDPQGGADKALAAADQALAELDIAQTVEVVDLDLLFDSLGALADNAPAASAPLQAALDTIGPAPQGPYLQGPLAVALDSLSDDPAAAAAKAQIIADES